MVSRDRVPDNLLSGGGGCELRLAAEAAGDDHASDGARRGAAEGACGAVEGSGEPEGWAERGHGWHCGCGCLAGLLVVVVGVMVDRGIGARSFTFTLVGVGSRVVM